MGDWALCIFPTPADYSAQVAVATEALTALKETRGALKPDAAGRRDDSMLRAFRAALHLGDVHYGNIGSVHRLDFTVVGPTVNLTARLLTQASVMDEDTVCSSEFAALSTIPSRPLGKYKVKGFEHKITMYGLD